MAKHCTNCGHELRETDKFCSECGTGIGGVKVQTQPTQWETGIIYRETVSEPNWVTYHWDKFYLEALGPKGKRVLSQTDKFKVTNNSSPDSRNHGSICDEFIRRVIADGWELTGEMGQNWWNYKFRRPVKS